MGRNYQIEFAGEIHKNLSVKDVVSSFADTFKIPREKSEKFILLKRRRTIKKNLTFIEAENYKKKLSGIGLKVRVMEMNQIRKKEPVFIISEQAHSERDPECNAAADVEISFVKPWAFYYILSILVAVITLFISGFLLGIISIIVGFPRDTAQMAAITLGIPIGLYASFYYYRWSINKYILPQM